MNTAMRSSIRSIALILFFAFFLNQLFYSAKASAQTVATNSQTAPAPIQRAAPVSPQPAGASPTQIVTARTVFLTNSGADANFPIDATQAYNDIYSALQAWGHYQLVGTPEQADLVFQLRDIAPITDITGYHGDISSASSPAFQLTIIDPKTNIALWTITSPVNLTGKNQVFARWVSISETNLVSRIKVLANQPLSPTETADLTTFPKYHHLRTILILTGVVVGVAAVGTIILHHEFDNSLANQKRNQDKFCMANNIPLNECAGG